MRSLSRTGRCGVRWVRTAAALATLLAIAAWNALLARVRPEPEATSDDPDLVEHERSWGEYLRGFHAHHGDAPGDRPEDGSLREGLLCWQSSSYLRGYTLGDHVYLCPNAPRVLRVHQAGHAPSFGAQFEPLRRPRRDDGGLDDEPLSTLDVMMPGRFPHTLLRLRDSRGLAATYEAWLAEGRIARR